MAEPEIGQIVECTNPKLTYLFGKRGPITAIRVRGVSVLYEGHKYPTGMMWEEIALVNQHTPRAEV